jgi:hypothetical protein
MPGLADTPGIITLRVQLPVAMASATTNDEYPGVVLPTNAKIVAGRFVPLAAITANGTNFTTLSVRNRKADASGSALPLGRSWAATNSTAFKPDTMTLSGTAADALVAAGDVLTVQRVATASGLVIPAGTVEIDYLIR